MSLFAELKRRNVFRAATVYAAVAWLLIQVAETTFPAFGLDDRALRMVIIALAIGFAPAILIAWLFELTPEGFKRESELDHAGALAARTNRLFDRAIVALLALGVTYFAIDKFLLSPAREQTRLEQAMEQGRSQARAERLGEKSIVVLPFANLSAEADQAYFADGMAEEMLNLLAKIPELRVISRTSAFAFKGKDVGIAEIAAQLRVTHVLEGSVRQSGDRVRITAQLIEAETDSHLWSETFDRTLDDVFAIQDEIAGRVAEALRIELLGAAPKSRRVDPQAYLLTLQARQMLVNLGFEGREAALEALLEDAIALDPRYAAPWVQLHYFYRRGSNRNQQGERSEFWSRAEPEEWQRRSAAALERALELEPDNPAAIALRASRKAFPELDFQGAARDFERAIALDPTDPDVLRLAGTFASAIGRFDVGARLGEFAIQRDPLCLLCVYSLGQTYLFAGRLSDAEPRVRSYVASGRGGTYSLGLILLLTQRPEAALEVFEQTIDALEPWRLAGRALALHASGRAAQANAALEQLETGWGEQLPHLPAEVNAWIGRPERAWYWLDRMVSPQYIDPWSPLLQPLAADPRWAPFWARLGPPLDEIERVRFEPRLPGDA